MKYKQIPAAIHNFGHSFVSLMNLVDDEYIIDLLPAVLRGIPDETLAIYFPEGTLKPHGDYPRRLLQSVEYWVASFPDHLRSEGVDPGVLTEVCLVLSMSPGLRCEARAVDDRGKSYTVAVVPA